MKKLLMVLVLAVPGVSLADQVVQTKVKCVKAGSTQVFAQTVQEYQVGSAFVDVGEYQLWPLSHNGSKSLLISKIGVQGTYAHLQLGESSSSSVYFELPQEDGSSQKCLVEMTKVKGKKTYIFKI